MADSIELLASVNSIKRVDPYVKDILATATQVALYKFNIALNEWEKSDKEGALFVYSRNGEPFHSIMILNRLNKDNFIEPLVKDFDYQMQIPFLLYRNCKNRIYGIWFFNREECIQVALLIESLMDTHKEKGDDRSQRLDKIQNGQGKADIFSMLSKAQEDFNRTPTKQDSAPPFASTPRVPDVTSQSVMDFFAKASSKSTSKPVSSGENVLHRLMSNPAHSVEHIEKQQRSVTPQEQASFKSEPSFCADRRSVPVGIQGPSGSHNKFGFEVNGRNLPTASPPKPINVASSASPLAFLMQNQPQEDTTEAPGSSPFAQFLENAQKPLLMTPMMFTAPSLTKEKSAPEESRGDSVEILTDKQLAQALIYMLKNNADFIKQIHQAYVNSILEKVDTSNGKSFI